METVIWGAGRQRYSYRRGSGSGPWLVVIHGGAWRDPSTTDKSAIHLIDSVEAAYPNKYAGFASIDYRLSPEATHPAHIDDVSDGFKDLCKTQNVNRVVLAGHSCGAFLSGQLGVMLGSAVERIIAMEGIYDLFGLVSEYPDYEGFVRDAFKDDWPRVDWPQLPPMTVIHSRGDELLTLRQPQWLQSQRAIDLVILPHGKHDEVYELLDLSPYF